MISIAMATYNGALFLPAQIDSILKQTLQDFELVICDDCSLDNTWQILQHYQQADNRIKIYKNVRNLGYVRNFAKAMSLCSGNYIALSDQDDIWYPNHLEVLKENIEDNMVVCAEEDLINTQGESLGMTIGSQQRLDRIPRNKYELAMTSFYYRSPWTGAVMMIKRDFLSKALPIPDGANYHDSWFAILSCFSGGFKYVDIPISQFRQHGNNASGNKSYRKGNPILVMLSRIFLPINESDRPAYVKEIENRVEILSEQDKNMLGDVVRYYRQTQTFWGRIKNLFFEMKNFQTIYTCK